MTPKSYISFCILGLIYVVMCTTAVLSPHGAFGAPAVPPMTSPLTGITEVVTFKDSSGAQVELEVEAMGAFAKKDFVVAVDGKETAFKATEFLSVMKFVSFKNTGSTATLKTGDGKEVEVAMNVLMTRSAAYMICADSDGNPLDTSVYGGYFCVAYKDADGWAFVKDVREIVIG